MMENMRNYILLILVCFLTIRCNSDENELTPSRADRDWFAIEDSDDPVGFSNTIRMIISEVLCIDHIVKVFR